MITNSLHSLVMKVERYVCECQAIALAVEDTEFKVWYLLPLQNLAQFTYLDIVIMIFFLTLFVMFEAHLCVPTLTWSHIKSLQEKLEG